LAGAGCSCRRRGLVPAAPGACATSPLLRARRELLAGAPRVRSGDRLSFHHFSAETQARVRLLDGDALAPSSSGRVQLRLREPIAAMPGDRFVIRRLSPVETIGGGVLLDVLLPRIPRRALAEALGWLDRLESPLSEKLVLWVEQAREKGSGEEELAARAGVSRDEVRSALTESLSAGRVVALKRSPDRYVSKAFLDRLAAAAVEAIREYTS